MRYHYSDMDAQKYQYKGYDAVRTSKLQFFERPLYQATPQHPKEVLCPGSDDELDEHSRIARRLRYEEHGERYLKGHPPNLVSASLWGPFDKASGWENPWAKPHLPPPVAMASSKLSAISARSQFQTTLKPMPVTKFSAANDDTKNGFCKINDTLVTTDSIDVCMPSQESQQGWHIASQESVSGGRLRIENWAKEVTNPTLQRDEFWAPDPIKSGLQRNEKKRPTEGNWLKTRIQKRTKLDSSQDSTNPTPCPLPALNSSHANSKKPRKSLEKISISSLLSEENCTTPRVPGSAASQQQSSPMDLDRSSPQARQNMGWEENETQPHIQNPFSSLSSRAGAEPSIPQSQITSRPLLIDVSGIMTRNSATPRSPTKMIKSPVSFTSCADNSFIFKARRPPNPILQQPGPDQSAHGGSQTRDFAAHPTSSRTQITQTGTPSSKHTQNSYRSQDMSGRHVAYDDPGLARSSQENSLAKQQLVESNLRRSSQGSVATTQGRSPNPRATPSASEQRIGDLGTLLNDIEKPVLELPFIQSQGQRDWPIGSARHLKPVPTAKIQTRDINLPPAQSHPASQDSQSMTFSQIPSWATGIFNFSADTPTPGKSYSPHKSHSQPEKYSPYITRDSSIRRASLESARAPRFISKDAFNTMPPPPSPSPMSTQDQGIHSRDVTPKESIMQHDHDTGAAIRCLPSSAEASRASVHRPTAVSPLPNHGTSTLSTAKSPVRTTSSQGLGKETVERGQPKGHSSPPKHPPLIEPGTPTTKLQASDIKDVMCLGHILSPAKEPRKFEVASDVTLQFAALQAVALQAVALQAKNLSQTQRVVERSPSGQRNIITGSKGDLPQKVDVKLEARPEEDLQHNTQENPQKPTAVSSQVEPVENVTQKSASQSPAELPVLEAKSQPEDDNSSKRRSSSRRNSQSPWSHNVAALPDLTSEQVKPDPAGDSWVYSASPIVVPSSGGSTQEVREPSVHASQQTPWESPTAKAQFAGKQSGQPMDLLPTALETPKARANPILSPTGNQSPWAVVQPPVSPSDQNPTSQPPSPAPPEKEDEPAQLRDSSLQKSPTKSPPDPQPSTEKGNASPWSFGSFTTPLTERLFPSTQFLMSTYRRNPGNGLRSCFSSAKRSNNSSRRVSFARLPDEDDKDDDPTSPLQSHPSHIRPASPPPPASAETGTEDVEDQMFEKHFAAARGGRVGSPTTRPKPRLLPSASQQKPESPMVNGMARAFKEADAYREDEIKETAVAQAQSGADTPAVPAAEEESGDAVVQSPWRTNTQTDEDFDDVAAVLDNLDDFLNPRWDGDEQMRESEAGQGGLGRTPDPLKAPW